MYEKDYAVCNGNETRWLGHALTKSTLHNFQLKDVKSDTRNTSVSERLRVL